MGQRHPNRMHPSTLRVEAQQNPIFLGQFHQHTVQVYRAKILAQKPIWLRVDAHAPKYMFMWE